MPVDPGVPIAAPPKPKSTVAPKGRAPQGPAAFPQGPKPQGPLELPHPALQAVGVKGGIQTFNQKVQQIAAAHENAYGLLPTPGLTLDVAKSDVDPGHYPALFSVPKNPIVAKAQGTLAQHKQQNPNDYFITRPDGIVQPNNPLRALLHPDLSDAGTYQVGGLSVTTDSTVDFGKTPKPKVSLPPTVEQLQKKYPMVMEGGLPIPGADSFFKALGDLNRPVVDHQPNEKLAAINPLSKFTGPTTQDTQQARHDVYSITQAQKELNVEMGTKLPVTGTINDDWVKALSNWTKTADYFRKQLAFQANDAGFGKNVGGYIKAWKSKQKAMQHGLTGHFLSNMPLPLFGHGGFWQDIASLPDYLKGSSNNPLNIGLHSLTRSAGLTLDTVGGTVQQAKADAAAGTTFATFALGLHGKFTYEEALKKSRDQLQANPSYMRIFAGGFLPTDEHGFLKGLDEITNVAGDFLLLRKPSFTGESVASGDLAVARNSTYLNTAARWAYQDLVKYGDNGIGRAASRLEGGQGSRAFVSRAAELVKSGKMTQEQFANHLAELYATGKTTLPNVSGKVSDVSGPTLSSLRTDKLPTPGTVGTWLTAKKSGLRDALDNYDATARGPNSGLFDRAPDLVLSLRAAVAHAAPQGGRLGYFQDILPERVFNFVIKHKLGDDSVALANKLESDLVRFQGRENIRGVQSVEKQIKQLYHEKYGRAGTDLKDDPFAALLETEAPSVFKFPGGDERKAEDAFTSIGSFTNTVNAGLNRAAKIHARIILSGLNPLTGLGGFSLFWKHSIGDGLRAVVGGIGAALTPEVRAARKELDALAASDPEAARRLGATLDRLRTGEANWALNRGGWNVTTKSFRTGDFTDTPHMNAAGEFLRRQLDSNALEAYEQGSLVDLVLKDKTFRALWQTAKKSNPTLSAEDYAALIEQRYNGIVDTLQAKGLTLDDAAAVLRSNVGHDAGPELGKWIRDNNIDIPVDHGQVETRGTFDDLTGRWIGNVIMRPNKFWRKSLGETILSKHYADLRAAGFDQRTALDVASDVAEKTTKFHMLDFANRLQVEQDLRWLSYFATKHRLYWKWVTSTFLRHPGYAAVVSDFQQTLNKSGGISLPFTVAGQKWTIPLERLVWVPGREYDETSPLALGVWNFIKSGGTLDAAVKGAAGTQGNILTRSDTATALGTKLLKIEIGSESATYGYARAGLDKATGDKVNRAINEYQIEFYKAHGHYAPESQVVKSVLLHQMGQEYWRANLPLPVVPDTARTDQQALLAQYMTLIDPKARSKFLTDHPGFSDTFGVYSDPKTYLHNKEFFARWSSALDAYHSARRDLYAQAKKDGEWTIPLEKKRRELNDALQKTRNKLLIDDARQSGIDPKGGIPNGTTIPYGKWGRIVNKDPQFDPEHFLSALFPKLAKGQQGDIVGPIQKSLQNELTLLNDPQYVRTAVQTPEEIKTLKREILQKLEVFKSYPSDALGKVRDVYQTKYVNKYWATYDAKVNAIKNASSDKRSAADAAFRAWRDLQDKPITVDGIQFPAPLRMAWATLDPKTRTERLSYLASKPFTSLADYELDLLDIKHPKNVSIALSAIDQAKQEYRDKYPGHSIGKAQLIQVAKQIGKQRGYEGFYAYYVNTLTQPRVVQFEQTGLYREMPKPIRTKFDQVIGSAALQVAAGIKASKKSSYYSTEWRKAVETQIQPWLDDPENKDIKDYLAPYGPNFLNQLPG